jgi:hypothetical protein
MKITSLFKKDAKKNTLNSFQKIEDKHMNKVLGGTGTTTTPTKPGSGLDAASKDAAKM